MLFVFLYISGLASLSLYFLTLSTDLKKLIIIVEIHAMIFNYRYSLFSVYSISDIQILDGKIIICSFDFSL